MEYVYIVIMLALIEYTVFAMLVSRARARYGVAAPAISGPPEFERAFRVHQNTLEGLIVLVPAMWIFAAYVDPMVSAGLGLLGVVGRILYARGYLSAAEKRVPGSAICGIVNLVLMFGALLGLIVRLVYQA